MSISKILIIMRRSNGDVFLSSPLINSLYKHYNHPQIDILVNEGTIKIAKTLSHINNIITFSYKIKRISPIRQEIEIIKSIYKKYDLSINLTSSDRSVLYAILASKFSISAIDQNKTKSWWKKIFLTKTYIFNTNHHAIYNMLTPLSMLDIDNYSFNYQPKINNQQKILSKYNLEEENYIIFHPSAQYWFRTYPLEQINKLIKMLITLNIKIIITGINDDINKYISNNLLKNDLVINLISKTSLNELFVLIKACKMHVGMDTLNTHIAASFNKKLIAIYGPNGVKSWSPFNAQICYSPTVDTPPITRYGNITVIQADMSCVPCNKNGCNGCGHSDCLDNIDPSIIYKEVKNWLIKFR